MSCLSVAGALSPSRPLQHSRAASDELDAAPRMLKAMVAGQSAKPSQDNDMYCSQYAEYYTEYYPHPHPHPGGAPSPQQQQPQQQPSPQPAPQPASQPAAGAVPVPGSVPGPGPGQQVPQPPGPDLCPAHAQIYTHHGEYGE